MTYKTYEKYKNTDVVWIGDIPYGWHVIKSKYLLDTISGGCWGKDIENDGGTIVLRSTEISLDGNWQINNPARRLLTTAEINNSLLMQGDLLVTKSSGSEKHIGKTALVTKEVEELECCFSNFMTRLHTNDKFLSKLMYYLLNSVIVKSQFNYISNSTVGLSNLNDDSFKNLFIPVTDIETQKKIINYLDKKTAKIDAIIAKNEELIQLLEEKRVALINQVVTKGLNPDVPMKDSGVEWIGEIPEHWDVEKIKHISQVKPSNVDKKSKDNEPPVLLCNYTDVYNNEFITIDLDFMKATASQDQIRKLSLDVGDIILTKDSESADDIAVPAIVTEELENVVCGYHLAVIKPNSNIVNPKFLFRSFESDKINKQFELGANGVTRFGLGSYPINNAWVCLPPLKEQKEIAGYINNETSKIFKAIDKITKHNELLEEYKTSLIHHVVTGKIDVREEVI